MVKEHDDFIMETPPDDFHDANENLIPTPPGIESKPLTMPPTMSPGEEFTANNYVMGPSDSFKIPSDNTTATPTPSTADYSHIDIPPAAASSQEPSSIDNIFPTGPASAVTENENKTGLSLNDNDKDRIPSPSPNGDSYLAYAPATNTTSAAPFDSNSTELSQDEPEQYANNEFLAATAGITAVTSTSAVADSSPDIEVQPSSSEEPNQTETSTIDANLTQSSIQKAEERQELINKMAEEYDVDFDSSSQNNKQHDLDDYKESLKTFDNNREDDEENQNDLYTNIEGDNDTTDVKKNSNVNSAGNKKLMHGIAALVVTLIVIGIIVAVVLTVGNNDDDGSTEEPTPPTPFRIISGNTANNECIGGSSISMSNDGNRILYSSRIVQSASLFVNIFDIARNQTSLVNSVSNLVNILDYDVRVALSGDGKSVAYSQYLPDSETNSVNVTSVMILRETNGIWSQIGDVISFASTAGQLALALDTNGNSLAVGNQLDSEFGALSGVAYLYRYDNTTDKWLRLGEHNGVTQGVGYRRGKDVDISGDGLAIAIGAPSNGLGGEFEVTKYNLTDGTNSSLTLTALGMAGAIGVGEALSLSDDAQRILVGAPRSSFQETLEVGKAYVYQSKNGVFDKVGDIIIGSNQKQHLGYQVAMAKKTTVILISSQNPHKVQMFDYHENWEEVGNHHFSQEESYGFGISTAISQYADKVAISSIGTNKCGKIYLYDTEELKHDHDHDHTETS